MQMRATVARSRQIASVQRCRAAARSQHPRGGQACRVALQPIAPHLRVHTIPEARHSEARDTWPRLPCRHSRRVAAQIARGVLRRRSAAAATPQLFASSCFCTRFCTRDPTLYPSMRFQELISHSPRRPDGSPCLTHGECLRGASWRVLRVASLLRLPTYTLSSPYPHDIFSATCSRRTALAGGEARVFE